VEVPVDVAWWLDGMHESYSVVLEDAGAVVDPLVHVGDEEAGEVVDGRH